MDPTHKLELKTFEEQWPGEQLPRDPKTPSEWFSRRFPKQVKQYGAPCLELREQLPDGFQKVTALDINKDLMAAILGGDENLKHRVIYYAPELQFYYYDVAEKLFIPTTEEKVGSLLRGYFVRCAQEMKGDVPILNLFRDFRSDSFIRSVVQRAKSVLEAGPSFFAPDSTNQRREGPELPEKIARVLIETLLEKREGAVLTVTQAYNLFCQLSQQRNAKPIPRSSFKGVMAELMREVFGIGIRRDLVNEQNKAQEGWKGAAVLV